ncbi:Glucan endo-1,3-beta-glucosidase, partial [Linum perenne]
AEFLKTHSTIDRFKIFDANPDIIRAFADTGISVTVTVANADVPATSKLPAAQDWIANNILPFHPRTTTRYFLEGNEVLYWKDRNVIAYTLPAMKTVLHALQLANLTDIKGTTPHALSFLAASEPPSTGVFMRFDGEILKPILDFHRRTKTPFFEYRDQVTGTRKQGPV